MKIKNKLIFFGFQLFIRLMCVLNGFYLINLQHWAVLRYKVDTFLN